MQIPQTSIILEPTRQLETSNIDQLTRFQANKNRRYTQLQAGRFSANYFEVNLGDVQVFKEDLNVGSRIEATPPSAYLPFAMILPNSGPYRFCGRSELNNSLIQASGGTWDIFFENSLEYVCTAFSREYFHSSYELLTAEEVPSDYFVSKVAQTAQGVLTQYASGVSRILQRVKLSPKLLEKDKVKHLFCSELFKFTLDALLPTTHLNDSLTTQPKRILGVQRVIDYLQVHAKLLPDMQALCQIAELSERGLEYGFQEYLGITPIRYLRNIRLNGVRVDLLNAIDSRITVSDVALEWGFLELGRFSGEYRRLFQELPSQTLRRRLV
jgi:AraC family ethanolamine operon transcriptional activator